MPTTATEIREALDKNHSLFVTKHGQRYWIGAGENHEENLFAWPDPSPEDAPAVANFGEVEWSDDDDTPDYRDISETIAKWLTEPEEVSNEIT